MTNYREILRLKSQGYSERNIALASSCSRNTVSEVLQRAEDHGLTWPLSANVTNAVLRKILYPPVTDSHKRLPDYNRVRKELMRNGVQQCTSTGSLVNVCKSTGPEIRLISPILRPAKLSMPTLSSGSCPIVSTPTRKPRIINVA